MLLEWLGRLKFRAIGLDAYLQNTYNQLKAEESISIYKNMTYLCGDTPLRTVIVHKHFENLRDDLRKIDLSQEKKKNNNIRLSK